MSDIHQRQIEKTDKCTTQRVAVRGESDAVENKGIKLCECTVESCRSKTNEAVCQKVLNYSNEEAKSVFTYKT